MSRSIFVDVEAGESDGEIDESDEEATVTERKRQAADSVPLRKRHEVSEMLRVAEKWERYCLQREHGLSPQKGKRKADSETSADSRKRLCLQSGTPAPAIPPSTIPPSTFPVNVQTCKGVVVIHLPEISGECELSREWRISEASEVIEEAAFKEQANETGAAVIKNRQARKAIEEAASRRTSTNSPAVLSQSSLETTNSASPPTAAEEMINGAATPARANTPLADSLFQGRSRLSPFPEEWIDGAPTPRGSSPVPASPGPLFTQL